MQYGESFLDWWWRQIKSVMPGTSRNKGEPSDALIIEVSSFDREHSALNGNMLARRNGREALLGRLEPSFEMPVNRAELSRIGLRLPPAMSLHREFVLPVKAEHHLSTLIGYEIDKITPFRFQDVFWGIYGLKRDRQNVKFTLLIVPKVLVQSLMTALQPWGLLPAFIESGAGRIPLKQANAKAVLPLQAALLGLCCAVALYMGLAAMAQQQHRFDEVDQRLSSLMLARQELSFLHSELNVKRAVAAAAQANGNELRSLAMLTNALPSGTWLNSLSMTPGEVTLSGQSKDAAHLLAALAASPGFANPSFAGPITQTGAGEAMFSIQTSTSH
jgi:general secretion pathway protein L